jgi:hypothetical protein
MLDVISPLPAVYQLWRKPSPGRNIRVSVGTGAVAGRLIVFLAIHHQETSFGKHNHRRIRQQARCRARG